MKYRQRSHKLTADASDFYNAVAPVFEEDFYGPNADPSFRFDVKEIWKILKTYITATDAVLEIGCGTGYWLEKISTDIGASTFGIDFSHNMVQKTMDRGQPGAVVAEAAALPFRSSCFDIVISPFNALDHCVNYPRAFAEISRVLKPTGIALLMVDNKNRLIQRYWHISSPNIESLNSNPKLTEIWTHSVKGETISVFSHFFTINEVKQLLEGYDVKFRGIGTLTPLIPLSIRHKHPDLASVILWIIQWGERIISRIQPSLAAHLFIIARRDHN